MIGIIFMLSVGSISIFAQGAPRLSFFPEEPTAAPNDGRLSLLAAAGGAYAIKKLRDKKSTDSDII